MARKKDAAARVLAKRYRLVEAVHRGAVTTLWRGLDEVLNRPVAIRTLDDDTDVPGGAAAFLDAAIAAGGLAHPRLASVYDADDDGVPFVVTEWVEGRSLADRLLEWPLSPPRATTVVAQVAEALAHAHSCGVPHLDLDAGNVLIGTDGSVKVTDLAVGAVVAGAEGHPVADGDTPAERDTRALGALLYACLTSRSVYGADPGLPLAPRRHGRLVSAHALRPAVSRELDEAVARACGHDVSARRRLNTPAQLVKLLAPLPGDGARPVKLSTGKATASRRPPWLRFGVPIAVVAAVGVLALFTGRQVGTVVGPGRAFPTLSPAPSASAGGAIIRPVSARDFDPLGDGHEKTTEVVLAYDGDPSNAWTTSSYQTANLSGRKPGVGLLFDFGKPVTLGRVEVAVLHPGIAYEIRATDSVTPTTLAADMRMVASVSDSKAVQSSALPPPATARYWLIWVTRLVLSDTGQPKHPYAAALAEVSFFLA